FGQKEICNHDIGLRHVEGGQPERGARRRNHRVPLGLRVRQNQGLGVGIVGHDKQSPPLCMQSCCGHHDGNPPAISSRSAACTSAKRLSTSAQTDEASANSPSRPNSSNRFVLSKRRGAHISATDPFSLCAAAANPARSCLFSAARAAATSFGLSCKNSPAKMRNRS